MLLVILIAAAFSVPLVGYLDPFVLLTRGLAIAVHPFIARVTHSTFSWLYVSAPPAVTDVSEEVYSLLRAHVLPFQQPIYTGVAVSAGILAAIFLLELVERRFWCRNLCPLGSLLTLAAHVALAPPSPREGVSKLLAVRGDLPHGGV